MEWHESEAQKEIERGLKWLKTLGRVHLEAIFLEKEFRYDLRIQFNNSK